MTGQLNAKSDVYSFGVVLLELLTRRKPVDQTLPRGQQSLVTWATPKLSEDKVRQCVDARVGGDYPPKAVAKANANVNHLNNSRVGPSFMKGKEKASSSTGKENLFTQSVYMERYEDEDEVEGLQMFENHTITHQL